MNPKPSKGDDPRLLIDPIALSENDLAARLDWIDKEITMLTTSNGVSDRIQKLLYAKSQLLATRVIVHAMKSHSVKIQINMIEKS